MLCNQFGERAYSTGLPPLRFNPQHRHLKVKVEGGIKDQRARVSDFKSQI